MISFRLGALCIGAALAGCARPLPVEAPPLAPPPLPPCPTDAAAGDTAWILAHGWHSEIGLRAEDASGGLAYYRRLFPDARYFLFGFGKLSFVLDEAGPVIELLRGPLPGAGVVKVTALRNSPARTYDEPVTAVALPAGGAAKVAAAISDTIALGDGGRPKLAVDEPIAGSLFYVAARRYLLDDNCNTWVAELLYRSGLRVRPSGVLLPSDVRAQAVSVGAACRL